ncbi:hypothetical protein [Nostoc sp.]
MVESRNSVVSEQATPIADKLALPSTAIANEKHSELSSKAQHLL